jgi:hypothetical protein
MRWALLLQLACSWCVASGCAGTSIRVDALLVQRGLFPSRAAAKAAIADGLVMTRSGAVVKKASVLLAPDARLAVRASGDSDEPTMPPELAITDSELLRDMDAPRPSPISSATQGNMKLTKAGEEALLAEEGPPITKPKRQQTAAARAASRRNARSTTVSHARLVHGVDVTNANGLQGRSKGTDPSAPKHKRYSKKNKRGTAL